MSAGSRACFVESLNCWNVYCLRSPVYGLRSGQSLICWIVESLNWRIGWMSELLKRWISRKLRTRTRNRTRNSEPETPELETQIIQIPFQITNLSCLLTLDLRLLIRSLDRTLEDQADSVRLVDFLLSRRLETVDLWLLHNTSKSQPTVNRPRNHSKFQSRTFGQISQIFQITNCLVFVFRPQI